MESQLIRNKGKKDDPDPEPDHENLETDLDSKLDCISSCWNRWEFINPFSRSSIKTDTSLSTANGKKDRTVSDFILSPLPSPKSISSYIYDIFPTREEAEMYLKDLALRHQKTHSNYFTLGNLLLERNKLKEAKGCFLQAVNEYNKDTQKLSIATIYQLLGKINEKTGEILRAFENFHVALEYMIAIFGNKSIEVALIYDKIGDMYCQTGQFEEAIKFFSESLLIKNKAYKGFNLELLETELNIAIAFSEWGKYNESIDILNKSLKKISFELTSPLELRIAYIYKKSFRFKEAKPRYEHAFELFTRDKSKLPPEYEHTFYNSLSNYYIDLGFTLTANNINKKAESIPKDQTYAYETLKTIINAGREKLAIGDFDNAYKIFLEAQDLAKKIFGKKGLVYSFTLSGTAHALLGQRNLPKARKVFAEALDIKQNYLMVVDVERLSDNLFMALIDAMQGDIDGAQLIYNECLNECFSSLGDVSYQTAFCYTGLGDLCYMNRNYNGALKYYQNSREIFQTLDMLYIPFARMLLHKLGNCLIVLGRYDEAKEFLVKSLDASEKVKERNQIRWASGFFSTGMIHFYNKNFSEATKNLEFSCMTLSKFDDSHPAIEIIEGFLNMSVNKTWDDRTLNSSNKIYTNSKVLLRTPSTKFLEGFYLIFESWLILPDDSE